MNDRYYFPEHIHAAKAMVFVDGENLSIRYADLLGSKPVPKHVGYEPGVFVWSEHLNCKKHQKCEITRRYYYTSVQGDYPAVDDVENRLKSLGIEAPRVFKKQKGKRSKRVDISLATDMLTHAFRKNYDFAVLISGDEDYVPLIEAVMAEGRRVAVWFFERGLSAKLVKAADHFLNLETYLLEDEAFLCKFGYL